MDRYHLLDLFVNNEKTLLKVYEALFPHRANAASTGGLISGGNSMLQGITQSGSMLIQQTPHTTHHQSHGNLKASMNS